jgi:2'-5' RNA ligase
MSDLRLFAACDVPEEAKERVKRVLPTEFFEDTRWVPLENQHVTLKFLGATPEAAVAEVTAACEAVARSHHPAAVALGELGVFPSLRRASVLWIGVIDETKLMAGLASGLDEAMAELGWAGEKRPFTPHLTLARFKRPQRLRELPTLSLDLLDFVVDSFALYRSHLGGKGSRYEVVERFPLASPP